jgi:hypothetical protein
MQTSLWLSVAVFGALVACGDSGTVGGSNAGGSNAGASNAGGSNEGAGNQGAANAGGTNAGGSNAGGDNAGGASPQEICEEYAADIIAKVEKCDLQAPVGGGNEGGGSFGGGEVGGGGVGGGTSVECDEKDAKAIVCYGDCFLAAPCAALDGTDKKAEQDYLDCVGGC